MRSFKRTETIKLIQKAGLFLILLFGSFYLSGQNEGSDSLLSNEPSSPQNKKLTYGLYIGAVQPNQYTAAMYNGYGFDINGVQNDFSNSWLYQKILYEGGYYNGQPNDYIAEQLNVYYHTWVFNEGDMPANMNYVPAFNFGVNFRYSVDKTNAILININAQKIVARGNFIIETPLYNNSTQVNKVNIQNFSIIGGEQRLVLMFGYQHLFGDADARYNLLIDTRYITSSVS